MMKGTFWKNSFYNSALDFNRDLIFPIYCVKMRWWMFTWEHTSLSISFTPKKKSKKQEIIVIMHAYMTTTGHTLTSNIKVMIMGRTRWMNGGAVKI
ncbi:MAG: hypothetical protein MI685_05470 [Chlorobiales bacterium]|nr:hypothetical protein [Chlorobiales bacterium]